MGIRVTGGGYLTRNEGGKASEGDHGPEVIPPEHALLETKGKPSNGDQARDEEEGQSEVYVRVSETKREERGEDGHLRSSKVGAAIVDTVWMKRMGWGGMGNSGGNYR